MMNLTPKVLSLCLLNLVCVALSFADSANLVCYERDKDNYTAPPVAKLAITALDTKVSNAGYPLEGKYMLYTKDEEGHKLKVFYLDNPDYDAIMQECSQRIKPSTQILGVAAQDSSTKSNGKDLLPLLDKLSIMEFLGKNPQNAKLKTANILAGLLDSEKSFKQFYLDYNRDLKGTNIKLADAPELKLASLITDSLIAKKNLNLTYLDLSQNLLKSEPGLSEKEASAIAEFIIRYTNQSGFLALPLDICGNGLGIFSLLNPNNRSMSYFFKPSSDHKSIHVLITASETFPGYIPRDQKDNTMLKGEYKFTYSVPLIIDIDKYQLPDQTNPELEKTAQQLAIIAMPTLFDAINVNKRNDTLFSNYVKQSWLNLAEIKALNTDNWTILDPEKK